MPYLNIDDGMDEHEKVEALSDAAFRLHMSAMLFCSRKLTDGFVSLSRARRLTASGGDGTAAELVKAGVWHDIGEGCPSADCVEARTCQESGRPGHYLVHDFLQWNHSAHWWTERRRRDQERQAEWRRKRGKEPKKVRK
ncbi:hypothetical protein F9L07_19570 [Pimelobacter simplex]|uniref:Uncharacterized protein n=1 Tax=Nocardioides simplex TaxID=2045 RepID=A0A7J5DVF2_NOCSI|nr:hypothetical protein [Pimelobacter simplex]KAB2809242.1 hypothetical protein F9L07_19570 [Pimelobacter simplex]